jgi:hypothetical protein
LEDVVPQITPGEFGIFSLILFVAFIALYIWLIIWVGKRALSKGYSRAGFTVFAIFLPIIAWIVVLILDPRQPPVSPAAPAPPPVTPDA